MRITLQIVAGLLLLTAPLLGQIKRLWVLGAAGEMVEYDPATFAVKGTVKVPAEAAQSPQNISVNQLGQILFSPAVSLPLSADDAEEPQKVWFWNGHAASAIDLGLKRELGATGSNQVITEEASTAYLSADGGHLFWFANQARRLTREDLDLSTTTTWEAWRTDSSGAGREDLTSMKLPECRCTTGSCEETCPYGVVWAPDDGVDKFFLMTQFVSGKTGPAYKASSLYQEDGGKWRSTPLDEPLHRVLDAAAGGNVIVDAIPDTGCCGWVNQSNDQTLVFVSGKSRTVFDEQATYKNPDYDVSFFTSNARLSPGAWFCGRDDYGDGAGESGDSVVGPGTGESGGVEADSQGVGGLAGSGSEEDGGYAAASVVSAACHAGGMDQRERSPDRGRTSARGIQRGDGGAEEVECAGGGCGEGVSAVRASTGQESWCERYSRGSYLLCSQSKFPLLAKDARNGAPQTYGYPHLFHFFSGAAAGLSSRS